MATAILIPVSEYLASVYRPDCDYIEGELVERNVGELTAPPFLCVEVLSPRDSMTSMQERIDDYFKFGVSFVWVVDPRLKRAFIYSPGQMREATESLSTANPEIRVPLSAIF